MKVYTKMGDGGKTRTLSGEEVWKDDARVDAYGTIDELDAWLGWLLSRVPWTDLCEKLRQVQDDLHLLAAELASRPDEVDPSLRLPDESVSRLERWIDEAEEALPPLRSFLRPGGSEASCMLHVARTICRRAERRMTSLQREDLLRPVCCSYINRLSDFLFMLARVVNLRFGFEEMQRPPKKD